MANHSPGGKTVTAEQKAKPKGYQARAEAEAEALPPEIHPLYRAPRGMHDILPVDQPYWEVIHDLVRQTAVSFGYQRIETPAAELPGLFERSLGGTSDVVAKELFFIRDRTGKEKLALRPEGTAGIVRAYLDHGMHTLPQPVKLWYFSPMFRHDRPQAGRYRQFWQFGVEVIGEADPLIDAQVIHLAYEILRGLQLEQFRIEINSIGHQGPNCRQAYVALLKTHAQTHRAKLCHDCKERLKRNPLRILDCKEEKCQLVVNTAPKLSEHLCGICAVHYRDLLSLLRDLQIPVKENPRLVRGIDYYTRTVFEMLSTTRLQGNPETRSGGGNAGKKPHPATELSSTPLALAAGGRYDGLVELLGGAPTPAVGFAAGVERILLAMRAEGVEADRTDTPEVFLVHLGDLGRKRALLLFDELRRSGFRVGEAFHKSGIKAQLRVADRLRTPWVLILGQKEALDNTLILRNMESGVQETLDLNLDALVPVLKKRLRHEGS
ncbi:MAG: histidyl-tRNA synthetase [Parcubacteria group bacterium Gr01-1014_38]|nr:MAG: histidyl-tRNA synthetase [Parcubacteria group bacterium Gr01-1014_38]